MEHSPDRRRMQAAVKGRLQPRDRRFGWIIPLAATLLAFSLLAIGALALASELSTSREQPSAVPPPALPSGAAQPAAAGIRVLVSRSRIDQEMARALQGNSVLSEPSLQLLPPNQARVGATVTVEVLGVAISVPAAMTVELAVSDGRVVLTPQGMDVGSVDLPSQLVEAPLRAAMQLAEDQVNASVSQVEKNNGLTLVGIGTTPDALELDLD